MQREREGEGEREAWRELEIGRYRVREGVKDIERHRKTLRDIAWDRRGIERQTETWSEIERHRERGRDIER